MTRRLVIAIALAAAVAYGVVAAYGQGGSETLEVGPGQAGEKSTSEPLYAGKRYRVTIEGTITRTRTDVGPQELDAFWCFNCGGDPYKIVGINARADDGDYTPYDPGHYTKAGTTPSYNSEHRYVLIFDNIEETRKLIFHAYPHTTSDSSGYTGGFSVTIEALDPEPKECKVTRYGRNPRDGQVAWLFTQGGRPKRYEATLKDSITVGRGVARIGHRRTAAYDLDNARGEVCHKDRYGITDPDPPHRELDFGTEQLKLQVIPNNKHNSLRPASDQESLRFRVKVVESDDPECKVGTRAFVVLTDEEGSRRDWVRLFEFNGGQCDAHEHTYLRGVQVVINADYPRPPA